MTSSHLPRSGKALFTAHPAVTGLASHLTSLLRRVKPDGPPAPGAPSTQGLLKPKSSLSLPFRATHPASPFTPPLEGPPRPPPHISQQAVQFSGRTHVTLPSSQLPARTRPLPSSRSPFHSEPAAARSGGQRPSPRNRLTHLQRTAVGKPPHVSSRPSSWASAHRGHLHSLKKHMLQSVIKLHSNVWRDTRRSTRIPQRAGKSGCLAVLVGGERLPPYWRAV